MPRVDAIPVCACDIVEGLTERTLGEPRAALRVVLRVLTQVESPAVRGNVHALELRVRGGRPIACG